MTPYETPTALRQALETRLQTHARDAGIDLERLRRRAVFERLLVRLDSAQPDRWVVKGGMALEVRLRDRARSTRDLDLAMRGDESDESDVRDRLVEALLADPDGDGFEFRAGEPEAIGADQAGRPGWRIPVEARLGGRRFATVRLDIVARTDELSGTERVQLPGVLGFAGLPVRDIEIVDPAQHFAEKLHAFTRNYGDRPNTRVKDLPDLVLLIEDGLVPDAALLAAVEHVFAVRATHAVPAELPDPPFGWSERYAELAGELDIAAGTIDEAMTGLRAFWAAAVAARLPETA